MTVGGWEPVSRTFLNEEVLNRLLRAASAVDSDDFGLAPKETAKYSALMQMELSVWRPLIEMLNDEELIRLLKFFTLAEQRLKGWHAGANSPVIALAKLLRERSAYPQTLTQWIRENSNNRFIPHGSLMDRL